MNANELAGRLLQKKLYLIDEGVNSSYLEEASTMLRQQQAEIERLTTKNLEWLANWNEQQAEIDSLKAELEHMRSFFGCDPAYYGMTYDPKKHGAEE
jgi:hypothetical protein